MSATSPAPASGALVLLSDEKAAIELLARSVIGLWDTVNTLSRLRSAKAEMLRPDAPLVGPGDLVTPQGLTNISSVTEADREQHARQGRPEESQPNQVANPRGPSDE